MTDLPPIERLQAVSLEPDDVLVVTVPYTLSLQGREQVRESLKRAFPNNRSLVISNGIEVTGYRPIEETT